MADTYDEMILELYPSPIDNIYNFYVREHMSMAVMVKLSELNVKPHSLYYVGSDIWRIDILLPDDASIFRIQGFLTAIKNKGIPDLERRLITFKDTRGHYVAFCGYDVSECYTQEELRIMTEKSRVNT